MESATEDIPPAPTRKPKYTKLTQQQLPACQPVLDPVWIIFIFLSISIVFIPIGGVCYAYGLKAKEAVYQYEKLLPENGTCTPGTDNKQVKESIWKAAAQNNDVGPSCLLRVRLSGTWSSPVYVYYQLERFYQNHRRYHKSRSDSQLADEQDQDLKTCKPKQTYNGSDILPCGLIAWSFFNDTYTIVDTVNSNKSMNLMISDKHIAPRADIKERFANIKPSNFWPANAAQRGGGDITTTLQRDERFILWMRTAALPRFRKLWGRIDFDGDLQDVELIVNITNQYNSYDFDGTKSLVFATTTWLGGRTRFLGVGYLVTGGTSLLMAAVYAVMYAIKRPSLEDARLLLSS